MELVPCGKHKQSQIWKGSVFFYMSNSNRKYLGFYSIRNTEIQLYSMIEI